MSKLAALFGSNARLAAGASIVAVGALGTGVYLGVLSPKDAVVPDPILVAQPVEPEVVAAPKVATAEPEVSEEPAPEVAAASTAPSVEEVRSEADGLTVIAGRAEPGSDLILFVDNVETTTVQAGNDGAFAVVTLLTPNGEAQVLSIIQRIAGQDMAADDIILAPRPVAAAEVVPSPEPQSQPEVSTIVAAVEAEVSKTVVVTSVEPAAAVVEPIVPTAVEVEQPEVAAEPTTEVAAVETPDPAPEQPEITVKPVVAVEEVAILKADETGVQIINRSSAPDVMSNVAIDTISYSQGGDVLLSGRAQSKAIAVRVYLNNAVVTTLDVDTSGRWRGDLPDVDTGIYTLRVDEVDTAGDVTSRVETPFKREAPEVLAAVQETVDTPAKAVTVQTGATLWAIARERYGDGTLFVRVVEANKDTILDADLIYPGQVFELPE